MKVEIKYYDLQSYVGNHLSVIGKRAVDKNGKPLYSTVMTQKPEIVVLQDYIDSACSKIVGTLAGIVDDADFEDKGTGVAIMIENSKWENIKNADDEGFDDYVRQHTGVEKVISKLVVRFVQSYTLSEYLKMFMPDYAKKYDDESIVILQDLMSVAYKRISPEAPKPTYTQKIGQAPSHVSINVGESVTISYTTDSDKIDDVEFFAPCSGIVSVERIGDVIEICGVSDGVEYVELYSRHNTDVKKVIKVTVTEE